MTTQSDLFSRETDGLAQAVAVGIVELADSTIFDLRAAPIRKRIGEAEVKMLAYNGSVPGPTLKVRQGSDVSVNFTNEMDLETTVHWHGLRLDNRSDGVPEGAHHGMQPPILPGGSYTYHLRFPDAGLYWYHPHIREDYTQEQGLYGNIIVTPKDSDYWPPVNRELALILDDILIEEGKVAAFRRSGSSHTAMGRFGNTMLTNGDSSYAFQVGLGQVIRLYLTNTANVRVFKLRLPGAQMKLVGGDNGRIERETFVEEILLAPSERAVVDVLFGHPGPLSLEHHTPDHTYVLSSVLVSDQTAAPSYAREFNTLRQSAELREERAKIATDFDRLPDKTLSLVGEMPGMSHMGGEMSEMHHADSEIPEMHHHGGGQMASDIEWEDTMEMHNRMSTPENMIWKLVDRETGAANHDIHWAFAVGDRVKIRIINEAHSDHPMQHPIHFHGQRFLVLSRDDVHNDNLVWKDTILVRAGETVDILLDMNNPGTWMAHCHIAEHIEGGMMLTYHVV